jgi:hypothetical protein
MRWDETMRELKLPSLSSFSKTGLEFRSDVDFADHRLKNVNIEANTTLDQVIFKNGHIENSVLHNVTATDLSLGDVALESLSISEFDFTTAVGSLVVAGEGGRLGLSSKLKLGKDGLDLNGEDMLNVNLKSGTIDGNINISVDYIKAKGLSLTEIQEDKTITSDAVAVIGLDGTVQMGSISIDSSGSLGDVQMHGSIDFVRTSSDGEVESQGGSIKGAVIVGGKIDGIEKLTVDGETELGAGLQVAGETYLEGSLTVSGSVLGSGPYVDVSDGRFKTKVERMESSMALEKILQLDGVSYELDFSSMQQAHHPLGRGSRDPENSQGRQFGFIAQEVETLFPEVVSSDEHGFKGLQYSRFAPIFVEGLKQLTEEVRVLQEKISALEQICGEPGNTL